MRRASRSALRHGTLRNWSWRSVAGFKGYIYATSFNGPFKHLSLSLKHSTWGQELSAMLRELQFQEPEEWETTQLPGTETSPALHI